jgi:hypothetical protein
MTNDQQRTDHAAHHHCPLLAPADQQAKAVVVEAEMEAVTVCDKNTGCSGGGSGGSGSNEYNGGNSNGRSTDKNNQQSSKSGGCSSNGVENNDGVDPQIPTYGQTILRSSSCTRQHHLNVA